MTIHQKINQKFNSNLEINILAIDISGEGTNGLFGNKGEHFYKCEIPMNRFIFKSSLQEIKQIIIDNEINMVVYEAFEQRDSGCKKNSNQIHSQGVGALKSLIVLHDKDIKIEQIKASGGKKVVSFTGMTQNGGGAFRKYNSKHERDANCLGLFQVGAMLTKNAKTKIK